MKDDLDLLPGVISVLRIARAGSFRAAMRDNQSGFRKLQNEIRSLEKKLGFLIFHRTRDGVVPTPEGKAIIENAEQVEEVMTRVMRLGKALNGGDEGEVVLATTEGLGTFWISPRLAEFQAIHDAISIRLHPSMSIVDMRRFDIDLAIQVVEPLMPDVKRIRLGSLHMMLCAAPSYVASHGLPTSVADLARHTFVFHTSPQSSDRLIIEQAIGRSLDQHQVVVMRNSSAHYMTVERGAGIGFIPTYGFAIGARVLPVDLPVHYALDIWLCFHAEARSIPRVSHVIDWLSSSFDPRLFPWFRREFVAPAEFDRIIDDNGAKARVTPYSFVR